MQARNSPRGPITRPSPSYTQKNLAAVHPEQNQPEHKQRSGPLEHRRVERAEAIENMLAEIGSEVVAHKSAHELPHTIERDRVQSCDGQRESPALPPAPVDHRNESRQEQRHKSAAEQYPRRGPDALHDREAHLDPFVGTVQ